MDEAAPVPEAVLRATERAVLRDVVRDATLEAALRDAENEAPAVPAATHAQPDWRTSAARGGDLVPSPPSGVCAAAAEWFARGRVQGDGDEADDRCAEDGADKVTGGAPRPTRAAVEEELERRCDALAVALGVPGADPSALLAAVQAAQARASLAGTSASARDVEGNALELGSGAERAARVARAGGGGSADGAEAEAVPSFASSALAVERASAASADASSARARAAAAKLASSAAQVRAACCGSKALGALRALAEELESAGAEAAAREARARREVAAREALGPAYRQLAARHAKVKRAARDAAFQLEQLEIAGG